LLKVHQEGWHHWSRRGKVENRGKIVQSLIMTCPITGIWNLCNGSHEQF
jgi:hypothetical protein